MPTKDVSKVAVVYARYSSRGQTEQSIEGQLAAAQKYAGEKGYTIVGEYIDRAMTGRNDDRDSFQRMLSDCAKRQFGVIIVWKVDRFGRNRQEITFNKYRAKKHGVRVEYVAENISEGPEGVILESVLEGMAEYYSLQLSQNVKRGLLESAKKHQVVGGKVPLGYKIAEDKTYAVDEETAPIVREIFRRYAEGEHQAAIISWLNESGFRNKQGKPFTKNSLVGLLHNERYVGVYLYKDLIRDENAIPAIIDMETFRTVQERLKINRRQPSTRWVYSDYLLTDKLFCGHCGAPMVGESGSSHTGRKYSYYACQTARKKHACNKKAIRQDALENFVMKQISSILLDDEMLEHIAQAAWDYHEAQDSNDDEREMLHGQIKEIEKSEASLVEAIARGVVSPVIDNKLNELAQQKAQLEAALSRLQINSGVELTKEHILFFLIKLRELDVNDKKCRKVLVDTFVNAVYLFDDGRVTTVFNCADGEKTVTLDAAEMGAEVRIAPDNPCLFTYVRTLFVIANAFVINAKIPQSK